jgi:phage terminase large subunit
MNLPEISLYYKFAPFLEDHRYKVACGGRAGMRSWTVARLLLINGMRKRAFILCAREFQTSIKDSVLRLLDEQIQLLGISDHYKVLRDSIIGANGTEFIFKGLHHNITEVKSTEGIDYCWVEEAENVSNESWDILLPTIRKPGSEIWVTYNPKDDDAPTHLRFVRSRQDDEVLVQTNYLDTQEFNALSKETLALAEYDKRNDPDRYEWVWMGKPRRLSAARIFSGKVRTAVFEPPADARFFHGADWGFAQDPTVLVRSWVDGRRLYVDHAEYGYGVEMQELPALFDRVPTARKWPIHADEARPETIAYMRREGYTIDGAEKGKGSVEDGVEWLRSFEEIVVHERCAQFIDEARLYSYKVDSRTGEVLPVIVKAYDHGWDALRYAYVDLIKHQNGILADYGADALGL